VLPIGGAILYARRAGRWYQPGRRLPELPAPAGVDGEVVPLSHVLLPGRIDARPPDDLPLEPARLGLARDDTTRPARGLLCSLRALAHWSETAPSARLSRLLAAAEGGRVLLLGEHLPALAGGTRYWGEGVLVPLGYRPDPHLPEQALRRALGILDDELVVLRPDHFERIPRRAFRPLRRSGLRRLLEGRTG
jgi:hypothetical protein